MPFLRPGLRVLLPAAITTAISGSLLVVPPAAATPVPVQNTADSTIAAPLRADASPAPSNGRFIVKFEESGSGGPAARGNAYGRLAKELGISVSELRGTAGGTVIVEAAQEISAESTEQALALLNAHPAVQYAEEDVLLRPLSTVNDPAFLSEQWNLQQEGVRAPAAWNLSTGAGQTIAILDTGITEHEDLDANVLPGYDFIADPDIAVDGNGRDADARDPGDACLNPEPGGEETISSWHGTHVAGIAAAVGNNGLGVAGVAYGAKLLPLRVMGACGGYLSDTVDAVVWAAGGSVSWVDNGITYQLPPNPTPARIINMSLGSEELCSPTLQKAIDLAVQRGSVVIAAAGNETQAAANLMPANCNNVITVGATSRAGVLAGYSNFGPELDLTAPGGDGNTGAENILSTLNTGLTTPEYEDYWYMQGTSMAAPHVSGVAALMLAANPSLTPARVESILRDSSRPLSRPCAAGCGTGMVDASAAVARAAGVVSAPSLRSAADVIAVDSAGTLWNYPSNGRGGLLPRIKIGAGWSALKNGFVADWNGDGVLDLIAQWKDGRLTHYAGKGGGGFQPALNIGSGWGSYHVTVGKWRTGDRYPSIVAADGAGGLWHYPNLSGGSLSSRTGIGTGWKGLYLTMTDFDGDSRMDLLAKKSDGKLVQYRSNGSGRFLSEPRRTIGTGWQGINSMTALSGFHKAGGQGIVSRLGDGRLAYYPFAQGSWGSRSVIGAGWSTYNLFR